MDEMHLI